jgi:hypothetical protein
VADKQRDVLKAARALCVLDGAAVALHRIAGRAKVSKATAKKWLEKSRCFAYTNMTERNENNLFGWQAIAGYRRVE